MKYLTGMVVGEKGTLRNIPSLFHYNFFLNCLCMLEIDYTCCKL
jgi:hypothetical protein